MTGLALVHTLWVHACCCPIFPEVLQGSAALPPFHRGGGDTDGTGPVLGLHDTARQTSSFEVIPLRMLLCHMSAMKPVLPFYTPTVC